MSFLHLLLPNVLKSNLFIQFTHYHTAIHYSCFRMKKLRVNCSSPSHLARALLGQVRKPFNFICMKYFQNKGKLCIIYISSLVLVVLFIFTRWKFSLQPFEDLRILKIRLVWIAAIFFLIWAFLALASVHYLKLAQPAGLRNRAKLIRTCKVYAWHHHFNSCTISSHSTKKFQEAFVARTSQEMGTVPQEVKDNLVKS